MKNNNINRELLVSVSKKDLTIQTFRGSGAGGQHRNKTDSAVRILHRDSGAVAESQEQRSQYQNKITAFKRLIAMPKFKIWLTRKSNEALSGESLDERVEKAMVPENIKIEYGVNDDN